MAEGSESIASQPEEGMGADSGFYFRGVWQL